VGVGEDAIAYRAAEQLVHRQAGRLALDVPQGEVDGADGGHRDRPASPVRPAVQVLPGVLDPGRVESDEQRVDMVAQVRRDRELTAVDSGVAVPDEAVGGAELEGDVVAARAGDDDLGGDDLVGHRCAFRV
jgi:hypothetical protein